MNSIRNRVQLIGHLGADPEIVEIKEKRKLAKFRMATNEYYKNDEGEKVTETQWHNIIAWGKTAELVEKLFTKGAEVAVEGKLINRNYVDKSGDKKYVTEVQANEIMLIRTKS
jgi:single-strand DNA-binding protein